MQSTYYFIYTKKQVFNLLNISLLLYLDFIEFAVDAG